LYRVFQHVVAGVLSGRSIWAFNLGCVASSAEPVACVLDSRESAIGYDEQVGFEFIKAVLCSIDGARL
jgi:hypothetical protein